MKFLTSCSLVLALLASTWAQEAQVVEASSSTTAPLRPVEPASTQASASKSYTARCLKACQDTDFDLNEHIKNATDFNAQADLMIDLLCSKRAEHQMKCYKTCVEDRENEFDRLVIYEGEEARNILCADKEGTKAALHCGYEHRVELIHAVANTCPKEIENFARAFKEKNEEGSRKLVLPGKEKCELIECASKAIEQALKEPCGEQPIVLLKKLELYVQAFGSNSQEKNCQDFIIEGPEGLDFKAQIDEEGKMSFRIPRHAPTYRFHQRRTRSDIQIHFIS